MMETDETNVHNTITPTPTSVEMRDHIKTLETIIDNITTWSVYIKLILNSITLLKTNGYDTYSERERQKLMTSFSSLTTPVKLIEITNTNKLVFSIRNTNLTFDLDSSVNMESNLQSYIHKLNNLHDEKLIYDVNDPKCVNSMVYSDKSSYKV